MREPAASHLREPERQRVELARVEILVEQALSARCRVVREEGPVVEEVLLEARRDVRLPLLDVVTARQELSIPPTITAAQAKGFTLYSLRTVLSGRGDELIDLAKANLRQLF